MSGSDLGAGGNSDLGGSGADLSSSGADLSSGTTGHLDLLAGQLGAVGHLDATGAAARFSQPVSMAYDGAGSLYVLDAGSIRKIDKTTGLVTTVASVTANSSALTVDGMGNIYFSDWFKGLIVKIAAATGTMTTLAGGGLGGSDGTGMTAGFVTPEGLALDGSGNLYVADEGDETIRQIVIATGAVTTLAGSHGTFGNTDGTGVMARFLAPYFLAADGAGSLYVSGNDTIRRIALSTATVTTIAGASGAKGNTDGTGAAARLSVNGGLTCDGGNVYVADGANQTIRKLVPGTGAVTTIAGMPGIFGSSDGTGTAARFFNPVALAADGGGTLYVADQNNALIRKVVAATGAVTTFAGMIAHPGSQDGTGAAAAFKAPAGLASDGVGVIYISDSGNQTIRQLAVATGAVTTLAGTAGFFGSTDGTGAAARFSAPAGLALDGAGTLYVADSQACTIRKIVVATGAVSTLAGTGGTMGGADGTGAAASFYTPQGVAADGAGNVYVADNFNCTIRKIVVATGAVGTLAGTARMCGSTDGTGAAARFFNPTDLALDGAGYLYVADTTSRLVRKIDLATAAVTTLAGVAGSTDRTDGKGPAAHFMAPGRLTYDGVGNLYVTDAETVRKIVLATAAVTTVVGRTGQTGVLLGPLPASLNMASGVAWLPSQGLAISDSTENVVVIGRGL